MIRVGEAQHPGPRSKGKTDKPISKTFSSKPISTPTTISPPPPGGLPSPFLPSRKPPSSPPQVCPVTCCPFRHGKEAQSRTTKQGLKTHVEMHRTEPLQVQVRDQRMADSSLHICPVCSRLISSTRSLALNNPLSQFSDRRTKSSHSERTSLKPPTKPGHAAFWLPCQETPQTHTTKRRSGPRP